jgi:hypothetical protein
MPRLQYEYMVPDTRFVLSYQYFSKYVRIIIIIILPYKL